MHNVIDLCRYVTICTCTHMCWDVLDLFDCAGLTLNQYSTVSRREYNGGVRKCIASLKNGEKIGWARETHTHTLPDLGSCGTCFHCSS